MYAELKRLTKLELVMERGPKIPTGEALPNFYSTAPLEALTALQDLSLGLFKFQPGSLDSLPKLTGLRRLSLSGTEPSLMAVLPSLGGLKLDLLLLRISHGCEMFPSLLSRLPPELLVAWQKGYRQAQLGF